MSNYDTFTHNDIANIWISAACIKYAMENYKKLDIWLFSKVYCPIFFIDKNELPTKKICLTSLFEAEFLMNHYVHATLSSYFVWVVAEINKTLEFENEVYNAHTYALAMSVTLLLMLIS